MTPGETGSRRDRWLLAALVVAIAAAWVPALHAPFTYDDRIEVVGNRTLRTLHELGAIASYNTSRPLLIATYALNWRLGGLDPFGYHVVSVALHAVNALLAYRLASRLVSPGRALLVASLWALHPMTTEAVTYVTGRSDALEATWWFLGIAAWIDHRRGGSGRGVALLCVGAALLTKEVGALLPVALLAVDRWLVPGPKWREHLPFWVAGAGAVALRLAVYGWPAAEVAREPTAQVLSQAEVWWRYAGLWAAPVGQSILHDHPGEARAAGLVATAGILGIGVAIARVRVGSRGAIPALCLALAAAWLLPSSAIPLLETMAEHRSYFAGFALVLLAVSALPGRVSPAWGLPLVAIGFAATVGRNRVWSDEVALWREAAERNPESARAWYGCAEALRYARRYAEAIPPYRTAAELAPEYEDPLLGLGIAQAETGDADGARATWQSILARHPRSCAAHNDLAGLSARAGDPVTAAAGYASTLTWCPDDAIAHLNLANLAWDRADVRAAAFHYRAYLRVAEDGPAAPLARERLERMGVE